MSQSQNISQYVTVPNTELVAEIVGKRGYKIRTLQARTNTYIKTPDRGEENIFVITGRPTDVVTAKSEILADVDRIMKSHPDPSRTAKEITLCVAVPSSEHVAKIVGGKRPNFKAWRAMIGEYANIKIPALGDEPVFSITGQPEHVASAQLRLVAAANHITKILAAQKKNDVVYLTNPLLTVNVRVPRDTVGLVVGPKGATIKRIQKQTSTFILTPSKSEEPCFEVTGKPEDVLRAKIEIDSYIVMRTGLSIPGTTTRSKGNRSFTYASIQCFGCSAG